jgi:hypothetical protein
LLQALIHLAAAGVKAREGLPAGVVSHARRAADHLAWLPAAAPCAGLEREALVSLCRRVEAEAAALVAAGADLRPAPLLPLLSLVPPAAAAEASHG